MTRLNLHSLAASLLPPASPAPPCTTRQNAPPPDQSAPLLLGPLPGISQLHQEASHLAQWEFERQAEDRRREMALKEAVATSPTAERDDVFGRKLSASAQKAAKGIGLVKGGPAAALKKPVVYHSHDVYRAIDNRDMEVLIKVRDSNIKLLLSLPPSGSRSGAVLPIIYAMRAGKKWEGITILLIGAFSKYVNSLQEGEERTKDQISTLKMLRLNIKTAIDYGLASDQTNLISSYLQVLVMSEGDGFIYKALADVSLALRSGPPATPVALAGDKVRAFATRDLKGCADLAAVEDYIANSTADLLILGLWSLLRPKDELPLHSFARDQRMLGLFKEALAEHGPVKGRLGRVTAFLVDVWGRRNEGMRSRVATLQKGLDAADAMR